jgi:hypothetical protein
MAKHTDFLVTGRPISGGHGFEPVMVHRPDCGALKTTKRVRWAINPYHRWEISVEELTMAFNGTLTWTDARNDLSFTVTWCGRCLPFAYYPGETVNERLANAKLTLAERHAREDQEDVAGQALERWGRLEGHLKVAASAVGLELDGDTVRLDIDQDVLRETLQQVFVAGYTACLAEGESQEGLQVVQDLTG